LEVLIMKIDSLTLGSHYNTEFFFGGDKTTVKVVYKDGVFLFSTLSFIENSITSIVANCEVF